MRWVGLLVIFIALSIVFLIPPYVLRFADPFQGPMKAVATPPPPAPVENYVLVVKAGDEKEAFYKLSYAHAYYRLFQMDVMRRAVERRLSELLGEAALDTDIILQV